MTKTSDAQKSIFPLRRLLKLGSPSRLDPEERHRRIPAIVILLSGTLTMMTFTPYHFYSGHYRIAIADCFALVFFITALFYLKRTERGLLIYWLISLVFMILCGITIVIGRSEISYFLWALLPPAVVFSVLGKRAGLIMSLIFLVSAMILMTAPERIVGSATYPVTVIVRYGVTYVIVTLVLYYYETSQQLLFRYLQNEKSKFEYASKTDLLTHLPNRRALIEKIRTEQERQMRMKKPFTLILGDIDNFKALNDTHGHDAGDYVLKSVAQILKDQVRGIDCPSRWGGEEFLIMLIETEIKGGKTVADRIRDRIEKTDFTFHGARLPVTMTFGLSEYQGTSDTLDGCIQRADRALYAGKRQGKNRVVVT